MSSRLSDGEKATVLEIVSDLQPEERFLAADYLTVSDRWRIFRRSPVDFGVETELNLITPTVTMVVLWTYGVLTGEVRSVIEERLRNVVRKMFGIKDPVLPSEPPTSPLAAAPSPRTQQDWCVLRTELTTWGITLGLTPQKAEILAELAVSKAQER
jgi:hypothetical protein